MTNKYQRNLKGVDVDVYDILQAFQVNCPATQHAIKKLLMAGDRGAKDTLTDLGEAKQSIDRAIELLVPGRVGFTESCAECRKPIANGCGYIHTATPNLIFCNRECLETYEQTVAKCK